MDIMAYSELSTENLQIGPEPANIAGLVLDVVEKFMPQAEAKGLELTTRVDETARARVDTARLAQALEQLVSNAVRFTDHGEVHIAVEQLQDDGMLVLQVRDTGVGMPQELIEHIGEPFQRVGNAYNAHRGGSGIGLAIARAVAEMHGGRLEIESAEGRGTCVRLLIPAAGAEASPEEADAPGVADESVE